MLFLDRQDVVALLPMGDCIAAVERAFADHARGSLPAAPGVLGTHVAGGGFHVKTAALGGSPGYYAAKVNANFPGNPQQRGLPTIQGIIALFDLASGQPLALLDSIEITTLRTAAASAVAARHLARANASTVTICGCGSQGRSHLRALQQVRAIRKAFACDRDAGQARRLAAELGPELGIDIVVAEDLGAAVMASDICVTSTPVRQPLIGPDWLRPGQFYAAVGADSEDKQEFEAAVLPRLRVVTDLSAQAATIGELHHAIAAGLMTVGDVHAELGQLASGERAGRSDDEQVFLFDSTGTALQDVAAAALVYQRAMDTGRGRALSLSDGN